MNQADESNQILNHDTLDFIFEYTKEAPEKQLKDVDALDNKVLQILSVASVVVGLTVFAVGRIDNSPIILIILTMAVLSYIGTFVSSIIHLKATTYRRSLQADVLWPNYWNDSVMQIKHSLVSDISDSYSHNKEVLDKKRRTLLFVLIGAGLEVIFVGLFVLIVLMKA